MLNPRICISFAENSIDEESDIKCSDQSDDELIAVSYRI
jgi:hypothetical protein